MGLHVDSGRGVEAGIGPKASTDRQDLCPWDVSDAVQ